MKKSHIAIGGKYAIRHDGDEVPGRVVRPDKDGWIVVLDPSDDLPLDPVSTRTRTVASRSIVAPWPDLDAESGWTEAETTDTGIPEVTVAEPNTALAAVQRLAAAIEPERPAGT